MAVPDAVRQALVDIVPAGWHPPLRDPDPRLRIPTSDSHDATETDSQATLATTEEEGDDGATVDLEEAQSVLLDILDAPLSRTFVGLTSATVVPLPHQVRIAVRAVETFPRGYLLADEVGLGKTVEAGLILRELLLSGRARTALLLVPASVLRQWQEELHEKLALDVPRYDRGQFRDRHDNELQTIPTANPWSAFPVLLASSHLARRADRSEQVLAAGPWDIVIVDEAHHARRRGLKATGSPNRLLTLLQTMRAAQAWKAIYLATATPMQMAPHEAWDLIELLGLPGAWGESADQFVRYFSHLRRPAEERDWVLLTRMLRDHLDQPDAPQDETLRAKVIAELGPARSRSVLRLHEPPPPTRLRISGWTATQQRCADDWLQAHTPMRDRVFRNTRSTMRDYQRQGLLPADLVIPRRHVHDEFIDLSGPERQLYDRIDAYIRRYYNAYMQQGGNPASQALGFVMTVYRRRLTSSFWAVRNSLARRRDNLTAGGHLAIGTLLDADDTTVAEDDETAPPDLQSTLLPHDVLAHLRDEVAELEAFIAGIDALGGHDSKAQQLDHDLSEAIAAGYDSVVVFTQYTDTMDFLRTRLAGLYQRV
ncbi:SNF2-related protein, partial [Frankia torreyi]